MGGKKKGQNSLGKAVIRDRFQSKPRKADSFLHSSELQDGFDWGRLNLQSVTEQSNLDDFLATAELADTEFAAEKQNVRFVNPVLESQPTPEQLRVQSQAQDAHRQLLKVPRRPEWDSQTSPEVLDRAEKDSFLDWRRQLAELGEKEHIVLTPFEKNLEFWRQLWRVIERSDIVLQIVDARNPLLYRCQDLEAYVREVASEKQNVILINKADFLTQKQREHWYKYFAAVGIEVVFWSATLETERLKNLEAQLGETSDRETSESESDSDSDTSDEPGSDSENSSSRDHAETLVGKSEGACANDPRECEQARTPNLENEGPSTSSDAKEQSSETTPENDSLESESCKWRILNGEELTAMWKIMHSGMKVTAGMTTVGLVGYPNVGKSSTINALLKTKKVPVSATPGRTKHFQTLFLEKDLLLCDCPGLVMPSFVSTKADMVVSGILPVDQMRDYLPPTQVVCQLIGRTILEATYGLNLPQPMEGEDSTRPPTAYELLSSYGYMRGFMTHKGVPDLPRSSRVILKDFVKGKLLYRHPPPGVTSENYEPTSMPELKRPKVKLDDDQLSETSSKPRAPVSSIDKAFFSKVNQEVHVKGTRPGASSLASGSVTSQESLTAKPWKRHGKRGNKEKLRRTYASLDRH